MAISPFRKEDMFVLERDKDTVAAVSTAPGTGGIAVIRVSGSQALAVTRKICLFLPMDPESHRVYFGTATSGQDGQALDEVLVTYFADGRSFTGEETTEISCHGGTVVVQLILSGLLRAGARLAERGEFTYRAFMNGRLDLVQAESVLQLIESQSARASRLALRHLKGGLSEVFQKIESELLWILAHLEANIDFAQEDLEIASDSDLVRRTEATLAALEGVLNSYEAGRVINEGFVVGLLGLPNVGKSSLLNSLLGEERAIVTDIPGTTRDFVEGRIEINGVSVVLTDTAGLRSGADRVEQIGIDRTRDFVPRADLILFVLDSLKDLAAFNELQQIDQREANRVFIVLNKSDLFDRKIEPSSVRRDLIAFAESQGLWVARDALLKVGPENFIVVSAKTGAGVELLRERLGQLVAAGSSEISGTLSTLRQYEMSQSVFSSLGRGLALLKAQTSAEFVALELHSAIRGVHEILGKVYDDQVMDKVFSEFCLGK